MLAVYFIISCTLFINVLPVWAGEFCPFGYSSSLRHYLRNCDYGCCGDKYSSYSDVCCSINDGVLAGAVIGSLVGLAIVIGLIVFCCVKANNAMGRTGAVIQPANTTATQTFVVNSTAVTQRPSTNPSAYGNVGYGYPGGFPPPAYSQYNNVPQGGTDPVYPSPPPAQY